MEPAPHSLDAAAALRSEVGALHASSFGWAMSLCRRSATDAEEVLQVAYAKILHGEARFDGRSAFKTWLFGVIRVTAYEHRRRTIVHALRFLVLGEEPARDSRPPEDKAMSSQAALAVRDALVMLPTRQREVLHLVFYEGCSIAEAAVAMGVGLGSARTHYERGKARLRELLAAKGVGR